MEKLEFLNEVKDRFDNFFKNAFKCANIAVEKTKYNRNSLYVEIEQRYAQELKYSACYDTTTEKILERINSEYLRESTKMSERHYFAHCYLATTKKMYDKYKKMGYQTFFIWLRFELDKSKKDYLHNDTRYIEIQDNARHIVAQQCWDMVVRIKRKERRIGVILP